MTAMIQRMKVGVITGIVTVCLSLATSLIIVTVSYERNIMTVEFHSARLDKLEPREDANEKAIASLQKELDSFKPFLQKHKW